MNEYGIKIYVKTKVMRINNKEKMAKMPSEEKLCVQLSEKFTKYRAGAVMEFGGVNW